MPGTQNNVPGIDVYKQLLTKIISVSVTVYAFILIKFIDIY